MISVIIPTYNRKKVLRHTLISLLNQSMSNYEAIVCDDGSDDGTKDMVDNFSNEFKIPFALLYRYHERNGFRAAATRNMGIEIARGDKIVFLDQDVILEPNALKIFNEIKDGCFLTGFKKLVPLDYYEKKFDDNTIMNRFESVHGRFGVIPATLSSFGVITKNDLQKVEKFDEEFIGYGLEDTELIDRLHDIKIHSTVDKRCYGFHIEHDYEPRRVSRQIQDIYHYKRNNRTNDGKIVK